jgi:hypothetical protein
MTERTYKLAHYRVYSFRGGCLVLVNDEELPLGAYYAQQRGGMVLVWHGHSSSVEAARRSAF